MESGKHEQECGQELGKKGKWRKWAFRGCCCLTVLFAMGAVGFVIWSMFFMSPPPAKVVHVRFGRKALDQIHKIYTSPRKLQQQEEEGNIDSLTEDDSPFVIDAAVDKLDALAVKDAIKTRGLVRVQVSICPAGVVNCAESVDPLALEADMVEDNEVPDEFTVSGLFEPVMLQEATRRLLASQNKTAEQNTSSHPSSSFHFEVNCDFADPAALESDGCSVELFNVERGSEEAEENPSRRLCGRRRRRRRRRREDRRRRRNVYRATTQGRRLSSEDALPSGHQFLGEKHAFWQPNMTITSSKEMAPSSVRKLQGYCDHCPISWIGDGWCDAVCNNFACNYDGGDCSAGNQIQYCSWGCPPDWLDDGWCDSACDNLACNFDEGDCSNSNGRVDIYISRDECASQATMGTLEVKQGGTILGTFSTLEPACESTQEGSGCRIPDGAYSAILHNSPKFGETYWLQNTWPRTEILIHAGNYPAHTKGCILPGQRSGYAVYSSRNTLNEIINLVGTETVVHISPCGGFQNSGGGGGGGGRRRGGCFPSTATVELDDFSRKKLSELVVGDRIRSFDMEGNLLFEPFLMDFHGQNYIDYQYIRLKHTGGTLEVSPGHLLFVPPGMQAVRAAVLRPGDSLFAVGRNGVLVMQNITKIEEFVGKGIYAPLTKSGRQIVDGVATSSYALLWPEELLQKAEAHSLLRYMIKHSHDIMHAITAPLRWGSTAAAVFQRLGLMPSGGRVGSDLHWFASAAKEIFEVLVIFPAFPELYALLGDKNVTV